MKLTIIQLLTHFIYFLLLSQNFKLNACNKILAFTSFLRLILQFNTLLYNNFRLLFKPYSIASMKVMNWSGKSMRKQLKCDFKIIYRFNTGKYTRDAYAAIYPVLSQVGYILIIGSSMYCFIRLILYFYVSARLIIIKIVMNHAQTQILCCILHEKSFYYVCVSAFKYVAFACWNF